MCCSLDHLVDRFELLEKKTGMDDIGGNEFEWEKEFSLFMQS
jgi:hypothetical protein